MVSRMLRNKVASLLQLKLQSIDNPSFHVVPRTYGFSGKGILQIISDHLLSTISDGVLASVTLLHHLNM